MTFYNHKHIVVDNKGNRVDVWHVVGPNGGISYRVHRFEEARIETCNIEVHYNKCPHSPFTGPDHINCWLLKAPCWHDGSSTAAEDIFEEVLDLSEQDDDESIYRLLEDKYFYYLADKSEKATLVGAER